MSSAFIIWFFALAFIATSITYIFLSKIVNEFILVINPLISNSTFSTLFVQNFNFVISVCMAIPLISLFSLVIWSLVRIIEEKRAGGF